METWYERASRRMTDLGLTQSDFMKPLRVKTRGAVGHYFTGRRDPSPEQLVMIADMLFMSLDDLLRGKAYATAPAAAHRIDQTVLDRCRRLVQKNLEAMRIPKKSKAWSPKYIETLAKFEYDKAMARGGKVDERELREQIGHLTKVA